MFPDADAERHFRDEVWRKRTSLFQGVINPADIKVSRDEILALCGNELAESRKIGRSGQAYALDLGPFENVDLGWRDMIMVQGLEQFFPTIHEMLGRSFGFFPRWQVDDVMASVGDRYASCGPHFDHYDVFLLQLAGEKTWQLDNGPHSDDELDPDAEIKLLASFSAEQELTARPGDVLYVPPGAAHYGICATDNCITLSIGLRNPTIGEMVADLSEFLLDELDTPTALDTALHPAGAALDVGFRDKIAALILDDNLLNNWYGSYVTRLIEPGLLAGSMPGSLAGKTIHASLATRVTYRELPDRLMLYINGDIVELAPESIEWVRALSAQRSFDTSQVPEVDMDVIETLIEYGAVTAESE